MDESDPTQTQDRQQPSATPDSRPPTGAGVDSPLSGLEASLRRPVSVGLALVLLLANVIGWAWFVNRQDDQFAMLGSQVATVDVGGATVTTDTDACWLVGASARAAGHGDAFVETVNGSGITSECGAAAIRGAQGNGP
ncbi:hypothetical protein [Terrabacter sp. NPDC000476]|uniref:hypothetical protein n=1 Tax=Terrabacter sp. NPDC000476 TaxID=3154258 RepID=UPI0033330E6C